MKRLRNWNDENVFLLALIITCLLYPLLYVLFKKCKGCKKRKRFIKGSIEDFYNYKTNESKRFFLCEKCLTIFDLKVGQVKDEPFRNVLKRERDLFEILNKK